MNAQLKLIEADFDKVLVAGSIKAAMKDSGSGSRDLWQVPIDQIQVIEGLNPRVMNAAYKAHIDQLAASMVSEGYYQDQPLAGYVAKKGDGQEVLIYSGHSRLAAAKLANLLIQSSNPKGPFIERLPVVVSTQGLTIEDITVSLVRGNGGKSLTYYETAIVCKRLVRYGFDLEEIARRTGFTVPLVKNRLMLISAPAKLREMVANDEMSATLAIELLNEHGENVLEALDAAKVIATTEGKTKVRKAQTQTKTDVFNRAKFVKKAAPKLYEAAGLVRKDPGFSSLSAETRELLESLLAEIQGDSDVSESVANSSNDERQLSIEDHL